MFCWRDARQSTSWRLTSDPSEQSWVGFFGQWLILLELFLLSGEDDWPGERSGGAARQRAEMGRQTQESYWTGKLPTNKSHVHYIQENRLLTETLLCLCQTEQAQLKLIQEKDLNDNLELEKASIERQVLYMNVCCLISLSLCFKQVDLIFSMPLSI